MDELSVILITLGALLFLGFLTSEIGQITKLPRVTLLLILGILIGPSALNLLPDFVQGWFPIITDMALSMVGFLLGGKITRETIKEHGRLVFWISLTVVFGTALFVFIGIYSIGFSLVTALLLAAISPATAPAATSDVVYELRAKGKFTRTLLGIVAVDDLWGLILFSVLLTVIEFLNGNGGSLLFFSSISWEVGGALLVGVILGIPMAFLTGRIKKGEPTIVEAISLIFICSGIAIWLEVSFLISSMVLGSIIANLAKHHERQFSAIEEIEWPFMILFFILAGSTLEFNSLFQIGIIGGAYVLFRILGRISGAWLGSILSNAEPKYKKWMGIALMPQAGVAMGMALVAVQRYPEQKEIILPVVISATVIFELIGPILTRFVLIKVHEASTDKKYYKELD